MRRNHGLGRDTTRFVALREVNRRHSDVFALPWLLIIVAGCVLLGMRIDGPGSEFEYLVRGVAGLALCVGLLGLLTKPRY